MSRIVRALLVPGIALLITVLAALAPVGLRRMDAFRVRQIEVSGARFLSPEAALAITGITDSSSVFDDFDAWTARLRAQRMIADARVMRRLPGTVRIDLVEAEPVALIRTPELRAVDAHGRLLPIRLAGKDLDAPLVLDRARIGEDFRDHGAGFCRADVETGHQVGFHFIPCVRVAASRTTRRGNAPRCA